MARISKRKALRVRVTAHAQHATLDAGMAPGCGLARHSAGASQLLHRRLGQQAELSVGVVRATSGVPAGGAVLSVPRAVLVTADAALRAGEWGEALQTVGGIDTDAILMLFLIHERNRAASSSGDDDGSGGWLATFVDELEALAAAGEATACPPCTWRAADRERLLANDVTEAGRLVGEAAMGLDGLHDALFPALSDALPVQFPAEVYTAAALRWAAGVLAVYAVQLRVPGGGAITAIVPLVAAAPRHRDDAAAFHEYDPLTDSYVLRTLRELHCGEEVSVCYGRGGSPAALLAEVGVVCAKSGAEEEHDGVALEVKAKGGETAEVRLGVSSEGGGLLVWPPRLAENLRSSELCKAVVLHRRKILAVMDLALGESAVVKAGRTQRGETMVLCREQLQVDLAVLAAVEQSLTLHLP